MNQKIMDLAQTVADLDVALTDKIRSYIDLENTNPLRQIGHAEASVLDRKLVSARIALADELEKESKTV